MAEIIAALDESGANTLLDTAIGTLPPFGTSGSGTLGPFTAGYNISATLVNGDVDLRPPDIIRLIDLRLNWHLDLNLLIDISAVIPDICLPRICVNLPFIGRVCTPRICLDWPTIPVSVPFDSFVETTGDFRLDVALAGGVWKVQGVVVSLDSLRWGVDMAVLLTAIGLAVAPLLALVPFVGPVAAVVVPIFLAGLGAAGATGLLGPLLTPFISGLKIPLYEQAQDFEILPAESAVDPAVRMRLDLVSAAIAHNGSEDELVLSADVSP